MTYKERVSGNLLIDKFLGGEHRRVSKKELELHGLPKGTFKCVSDGEFICFDRDLHYEASWDRLILALRLLHKQGVGSIPNLVEEDLTREEVWIKIVTALQFVKSLKHTKK